jgi:hypothetical protein
MKLHALILLSLAGLAPFAVYAAAVTYVMRVASLIDSGPYHGQRRYQEARLVAGRCWNGRLLGGQDGGDKEEFFMTRFVAVSGTSGLMIMALLVTALITLIAPSLLGAMGLNRRMVLILPLGIFILREAMLIRGSRFAPAMASLSLRCNRPDGVVVRVRQWLQYWMR